MVRFFCLGAQVWYKFLADYARTLLGGVTAGPTAKQGGSGRSPLPAGEEADPAISIPAVLLRSPSQAGSSASALPPLLPTQWDALPATSLGGLAAVMGTPQMASGCVFLQGLGFLISKFSPKAASPCHASCVSAHASPAAHGQWGFAACIFSWSSPSSLLEWPTRSLSGGSWPPLKRT